MTCRTQPFLALIQLLVGATETNVKHLLEMIKTVAPVHYDALTVTIGT